MIQLSTLKNDRKFQYLYDKPNIHFSEKLRNNFLVQHYIFDHFHYFTKWKIRCAAKFQLTTDWQKCEYSSVIIIAIAAFQLFGRKGLWGFQTFGRIFSVSALGFIIFSRPARLNMPILTYKLKCKKCSSTNFWMELNHYWIFFFFFFKKIHFILK